jgi:uncharacterized protein GlcG (DUF336 family)
VINRVPGDKIDEAARVVFEEAGKDGRGMAFAVVDEAGDLVFGTRMESTPARILKHAVRKAYTAAVMERDTITFRDQDQQLGKTLADWGDPMLTHLVGGVVITVRGEGFGGIGVGGNSTERDDEIARMALEVLIAE